MRAIIARGLVLLGCLAACCLPVSAQGTCNGQPGALGVSRTVEVDTSKGPLFGNQQYPDIDFLADGEVVLTFDDGPLRPHTKPVLEALAAHCTKATFFMVGRMAIADPEMVREVARRGHTVATHTWSHRNLKSIGPTKARAEVELGFSAVSKALGGPISPFFRFPYLSDPKDTIGYLKMRQMGIFSIDVDAYDYRTRNPADVHRKILGQLATKRKGIILFHDIQPSTAGALKGLLDEISRRGMKVVHLAPKAAAQTLPEYDAEAESLLARKKVAAVAQPLATRSVVWPIGTAPATAAPDAKGAVRPAPVPRAKPVAVPPALAAPANGLPQPTAAQPPGLSAPPPPLAPAADASGSEAAPRRSPRTQEEKPWQERIFSN